MKRNLTGALLLLAILQLGWPLVHADQYALLVGVREYPRNQLHTLKYTENDIEQFAKVLEQSGFEREKIYLMTQTLGARSTRFLPLAKNIMKELDLLLSIVDSGDTIIVAFTGHGVQFAGDATNYFCPADVNLEDRSTLISLSEVFEKLEMSKARHKVLLVDACRNDPQTEFSKSSKRIILEPVHERKPPVMEGGTAALFSCSGGEQSWEDEKLRHGVFFNFVIEGMKGKADLDGDKQITFDELKVYTRSAVKSYVAKELGEVQTPSSNAAKENIGSVAIVRLTKSLPSLLTAPFSVEVARESQQRWADYLQTQVTITNSIGMELVLIPPGEFMMGSTDAENGDDDEKPQHRVQISQPFLLGQTEVTKGQFAAFVRDANYQTEAEKDGKGGRGYVSDSDGNYQWKQDPEYSWRNPGFEHGDSHPVVNVSWNDAVAFCNWLSKQEGLPEYYRIQESSVSILGGRGYRLPTEAEWEYACRAGTTTTFYHGDNDEGLAQVGNVADATAKKKYKWAEGTISSSDGYAATAPVGNYLPNGFGLHDMHGNVWEWCYDWYGSDYYEKSPSVDPLGASLGSRRVIRGGGWYYIPRGCRSADRGRGDPWGHSINLGLRVASSPLTPDE